MITTRAQIERVYGWLQSFTTFAKDAYGYDVDQQWDDSFDLMQQPTLEVNDVNLLAIWIVWLSFVRPHTTILVVGKTPHQCRLFRTLLGQFHSDLPEWVIEHDELKCNNMRAMEWANGVRVSFQMCSGHAGKGMSANVLILLNLNFDEPSKAEREFAEGYMPIARVCKTKIIQGQIYADQPETSN